ncbi:gas vesicle protein GvpO [Streptomyces sp. NPDC002644]
MTNTPKQETETDNTEKKEPDQRRPRPTEVLREARAQLEELTGMAAESVSSFEKTEDGWTVEVEVLELERVPDTMSLLATYRIELDPEGMLTGYKRIRRYERGRSDSSRR